MNTKKEEMLKKICGAINKNPAWGGEDKNGLTFMGNNAIVPISRFSSGSASLDEALGGGIPEGRITEVYGSESSGKSTLVYHIVGEYQKKYPDEVCAIIDAEHTLDPQYVKNIGVKVDELLINQPDTGEQALGILRELLSQGVKLIVVDSIAALVPEVEKENEIGKQTVGLQARLLSSALRVINAEAAKAGCTIICTNQLRDKIGGMAWGDTSTTPGGRALKHYASVRIEIIRIGSEKEGDIVVANKVKTTIRKNKTAAPYKTANFIITFGVGIDKWADLYESAIKYKVIKKKGGWFVFGENGEQIQGRPSLINLFKENEALVENIKARLAKAIESGQEKDEKPVIEEDEITRRPVKIKKAKDDEDDEEDDTSEVEV